MAVVGVRARARKDGVARRLPFPAGELLNSLTALDQMVDPEQDESAHQGHDEPGGLAWFVVADGATDPCAEEGARDAEDHCDEDSTRIFTRHDQLCKSTDDQTDKSSPKQTEHIDSSVVYFPWLLGPDSRCGQDTR